MLLSAITRAGRKAAVVAGFAGSEFERMLQDAQRALGAMRSGAAAPDEADAPELEGVGEAADGRVKVTTVTGGRLKSVELDPRAMRLASQELGEQIVAAANAALDDLRDKAAAAAPAQTVDTAALARQLQQVQTDGIRQMEQVTGAIEDALTRMRTAR